MRAAETRKTHNSSAKAVSELQGTYQIAVVGADDKVSIHSVKVGDRVGGNWIISSGVKAGDLVIVEGLQKVRDGSVVKPKQTQNSPIAKGN